MVKVKAQNPSGEVLELDADEGQTVASLREQICNSIGSNNRMTLLLGTTVLEDTVVLRAAGIEDGTEVTYILETQALEIVVGQLPDNPNSEGQKMTLTNISHEAIDVICHWTGAGARKQKDRVKLEPGQSSHTVDLAGYFGRDCDFIRVDLVEVAQTGEVWQRTGDTPDEYAFEKMEIGAEHWPTWLEDWEKTKAW